MSKVVIYLPKKHQAISVEIVGNMQVCPPTPNTQTQNKNIPTNDV